MTALRRLLAELGSGPRSLALLEAGLTILLVLAATALAARGIPSVVRRALRPRGDGVPDTARALTLQPLLESVLRYTVYFIAAVMVLRAAGVDATAVLASAGVVGLAVGFGAQHLIRDVISGFFLLAEGSIQAGDVITVGEHTGQVERVSIRTTQVRKYSGELWTIPNGQIAVFGNASRGYMRAIVDVPLSYRADVDRAMAVMHRVAGEWAAGGGAAVLGPPEVHAVLQFGDTRLALRLAVTVAPGTQVAAERELRRRLKAALDREGVGTPFGTGRSETAPDAG
jgi:small conductance mechanosensitive channel